MDNQFCSYYINLVISSISSLSSEIKIIIKLMIFFDIFYTNINKTSINKVIL